MLFLYFLIFYILGIILWITKKYDILTISIVYIFCATFLMFRGISAVLYIILFFVIAEGSTSILNKKHGKRNYKNIFGNCLVAFIFALFGQIIVALATISGAFGDTMSSEIGRLSKKQPRMITTFKKVKKGRDGGITLLGISAAMLVSVVTALFFWLFKYNIKSIFIISISAIIGSLIDSVIGALLEDKKYINNNQTNFLATLITGLISIFLIYIL